MSRRAKVKVVKQKTNPDDKKDLMTMFSQLTGSCDAERDVIIPKINKIYKNIVEYNRLFNILLNFEPFTKYFSDYSFWFDDVSTFLKELIVSTNTDINVKYDDPTYLIGPYHAMDDAKLNAFYKDLKDNGQIKKIIISGNNLSLYKKHLLDNDDAFIYREPGLVLIPLVFTNLDLKIIWGSEVNDKAKQFIISILKHCYNIGIDMYDIITSPDVDIKKFSKILIESISQMKKQIPRCDKAFKIIENSVSLLEKNFKDYFRGSVEAGNPSIIIESFIVDISTSQKASPVVANEFRKIAAFLKANASQKNDPKVQKLFSMLNTQFTSLDSEMGRNKTVVKDDIDLDIEKDLERMAESETKTPPASVPQVKVDGEFYELVITSDDEDYEKISASVNSLIV